LAVQGTKLPAYHKGFCLVLFHSNKPITCKI
jgi:hypothetical protein